MFKFYVVMGLSPNLKANSFSPHILGRTTKYITAAAKSAKATVNKNSLCLSAKIPYQPFHRWNEVDGVKYGQGYSKENGVY